MKEARLLQAFFSDVLEDTYHVLVASKESAAEVTVGSIREEQLDVLLVGRGDVPRDVYNLLTLWKELIEVVDALLELWEQLRLARRPLFVLRDGWSELGALR